jgi:beta-glucanase (GH16 family)
MSIYNHEQITATESLPNPDSQQHRLAVKAAAVAMAGLSLAGCFAQSSEKSHPKATTTTSIAPPSTTTTTTTEVIPIGPPQSNPLFDTYPAWSQDFSHLPNGSLSTSDWNIETGPAQYNDEAEYNTGNPANLRVVNGVLTLEARQQALNNFDYTSARIDTDGKESFMYGKLVFSAELPSGIGSWPAIWLESTNHIYEKDGPPSDTKRYINDGEVDIVEAIGDNQCLVFSVVHTLDPSGNLTKQGHDRTIQVPNCNTTFNDYAMEWTPDSMTFSVNNQVFYVYEKTPGAGFQTWPFDQLYYLIIDLAEGGVWGGMERKIYPPNGIDNAALPTEFNIRSIYYYPYIG